MLRPFFALGLVATLSALVPATALGADEGPPPLEGKIEGRMYVSPTGIFKVAIPVLPELGGDITDTPNVVTFEDDFNTHISIAAFPQDATQRWELSTRGLKDYLIYFFSNFVLSDFKQSFQGVQVESAKFGPVVNVSDGALITFILIPGGTMFADKVAQLGSDGKPPVAKRGNLVFVKNGHIFVVSIELAERVIEGKAYKKTTAEEDDILRTRLNDIMSKIQFAKPPTGAPSPASTADAKK
jgi:hypothetical protein